MKKSTLIMIFVIPLVLVGLAGGGFIAYQQMQGQHQQNLADLEKFGFSVLPTTSYEESTGELGQKQVPATFAENKMTPTQKVIKGLMDDNEQLIQQQQSLIDEIAQLKQEIADLENYKKLNEHFAPLTIAEELAEVERQLKKMLIDMPDARRFSSLQIEAMAAASANEYKKFIGRKRLILSDQEREQLISDYMPAFCFCVGDGIEIAANSPREERAITEYFRNNGKAALDTTLKEDLETVLKPCQTTLFARLNDYDRPL